MLVKSLVEIPYFIDEIFNMRCETLVTQYLREQLDLCNRYASSQCLYFTAFL
uniref:Uncharacterized protein n=1 Tax=Arion vulgaris TaxID=1028688 RepID=A0A0B7BP63_9EUPU